MPYIDRDDRPKFDALIDQFEFGGPGELNYVISKLIGKYFEGFKRVGYAEMNEVIGVLECVKLEFYRRVAAPYEDKKIKENGDVF